MAKTHTYELKINGDTFEGEAEFSNAGVVSYTETGTSKMGLKVKDAVMRAMEEISKTYSDVTKFESFEIDKK